MYDCGICPGSFDFCRCVAYERKIYMTTEQRIEQAKRILPVVEAEIAGGETRQIFFDIRDMCLRDLKLYSCCQGACEFHGQLWCKTWNRPCQEYCDEMDGY